MGRGEWGCVEKEGARVKQTSHYFIITNIYNLFRVSLFHSDEILMCMHAQEVFFSQIRSIEILQRF